MSPEPRPGSRLVRVVLSLAVAAAGLLAIVGSGGGAVGFPPCEPPLCGPPPSPLPEATVTPAWVTLQVGQPARWTVTVANLPGTLSYQWLRRDAGASVYTEIPGATGDSFSLPAVNLGDDGASFLVVVGNGSWLTAQAVARLVVSATPGQVHADGEFVDADWSVSPVQPAPPAAPPTVVVQRVEGGGNPGAWRQTLITPGNNAGAASAFFFANAAVHDPATSGAVKVIDHAQDCALLTPAESSSVELALAIEQSGRRYVANASSACNVAPWSGRAGRASLAAADFRLFDGPACDSGAACPDFSAQAAPMRFGYFGIVFSSPGVAVTHSVDNWRVTVWR